MCKRYFRKTGRAAVRFNGGRGRGRGGNLIGCQCDVIPTCRYRARWLVCIRGPWSFVNHYPRRGSANMRPRTLCRLSRRRRPSSGKSFDRYLSGKRKFHTSAYRVIGNFTVRTRAMTTYTPYTLI